MGALSPGSELLRCTVRDCGEGLAPSDCGLVCARGHRFDRARRGFFNLLQPQDRRSKRPGDSDGSVLARRRLFETGVLEPLYAALRDRLRSSRRLVDVGCGEGHLVGPLSAASTVIGVDLAALAIDLAAKSWPDGCWVIANADRGLPVVDEAVDTVVSVAARRHPGEFRRVLHKGGRVVIAVPAADDLVELRELIGGEAVSMSRAGTIEEEFRDGWRIATRERLHEVVDASRETVRDLLAASYRGQRRSAEPALKRLDTMRVTLAFDLFVIEPLE